MVSEASSAIRRFAMKGNKRKSPSKVLPPGIKRHAHILCVLAQAKPKLVKQMIAGAEPGLLKAISECSYNILKGKVRLTSPQKKRLCRYKTALRTIAQPKTSIKTRKALAQKGGFLGALLGTVAPLIVSALSGLVRHRRQWHVSDQKGYGEEKGKFNTLD